MYLLDTFLRLDFKSGLPFIFSGYNSRLINALQLRCNRVRQRHYLHVVSASSTSFSLPFIVLSTVSFPSPLQGRRHRTKSGPVVFPSNGGRAPGRVREGGTLPAQLGGMGERCKLPHRGLGLRPRSQRFLRCKNLQNYTKSAIKI